MDTIVHFMLPVSLLTVKAAVEQGQCIRVNIMKLVAVAMLQLFWDRIEYKDA